MVRRATVVLVVVLGTVVVPVRPAGACTCAAGDPRTVLAGSPAAFVGRAVGPVAGGGTVWRFTVESAVKGDLGPEIDVASASVVPGGGCGLAVAAGRSVGLVVRGGPRAWTATSCDHFEPDVLLRAAAPPPPPAPDAGPAAFLVGGPLDGHRVVALDAAGRTTAYGPGDGDLVAMAACPGSAVVVEVVRRGHGFEAAYSVARRDVATLAVTGEVGLPGATAVFGVACRSAGGDDVVVHTADADGDAPVLAVRDTSVTRVGTTPPGTAVLAPTGDVVYVADGDTIAAFDVTTGAVEHLATVPGPEHLRRLAASPDGRAVAAVREAADGPGPAPEVVVVDRSGGTVAVHRAAVTGADGRSAVAWADATTLVQVDAEGGAGRLFDRDLDPLGSLDGWPAFDVVAADGVVVGGGPGVLVAAPVGGGPVEELRRFDTPLRLHVVALGTGTGTGAGAGPAAPGATAAPGPRDAEPSAWARSPSSASGPPLALVAGAGLATGAAGAALARRQVRRRRARAAGWGRTAPAADLASR